MEIDFKVMSNAHYENFSLKSTKGSQCKLIKGNKIIGYIYKDSIKDFFDLLGSVKVEMLDKNCKGLQNESNQ